MILQSGEVVTKGQIMQELKACEIELNSTEELVRWKHINLGVVFDIYNTYRRHCGWGTPHSELDFITPRYVI